MNDEYLTLTQASEQLGVSVAVLRRLCNAGLVPQVRRNRRGHRILSDWQVNHAKMILRLREAGMSKTELKRYVRLLQGGPESSAQRKALLETWRRQFWQKMEDCRLGIDTIERQIELIDQDE